jgi:hypothetical protein
LRSGFHEVLFRRRGDKPRWEKGKLWFRGEVVRKIRQKLVAKNIVGILDAFQEARWPESIENPLASPYGRNPKLLTDALASLNKGLKVLEFSTHDDRVYWSAKG